MDLMEHQARALFEAAGLPVPAGFTVSSVEELAGKTVPFPAVIKAQVPVGGRGKLGGIRFARNRAELEEATGAILGMDIKGHRVREVLITQRVEAVREMYLSILLDRGAKRHVVIFSPLGGVDIEQTAREHPEVIHRTELDPLLGLSQPVSTYLAGKAGLDAAQRGQLHALLTRLYGLCRSHDCLLAEINPLAVTAQGSLVALDAKVTIDDSALARLPDMAKIRDEQPVPELVRRAREHRFLYIPCDETGDVVVMSNGSGMLMSCIDHITRRGRRVSAVLDLGGGATADRIARAVEILAATAGARVLFINIFGGITRCDEVAAGIRSAVEARAAVMPMVIRLEGTNKEAGLAILRDLPGVTVVDGLLPGVDAIVEGGMRS